MRILPILVAGLSLLLPSPARAQRLEAGVFLTHAFLEDVGSNDHRAGTSTSGPGGRVTWRFVQFVDLEGELAVHPNSGVSGYRVQGFFGARAGVRSRWIGGFIKVRPGFLYFSKDPFGVGRGGVFPRSEWARSLDPALDIGGVVECYTRSGVIVRFDLGDTIVRYHPRTVVVSALQPPMPVGGFTTRNRQWSIGVGKRF